MQAAPRPLPADGARQEENPGEPPGKRALNKKPLTGEVVCPDKLTSRRHEAPSQDKEEVQLKERPRKRQQQPPPTAHSRAGGPHGGAHDPILDVPVAYQG